MYISSDTNIWIDFNEINHLEHPFLLNYKYFISSAALEDELIEPPKLREKLLELGLRRTEVTDEELVLALEFQNIYKKLSVYDRIALAIAKMRSWILLTGDKPLRNAAKKEFVECHGAIWIYDELLRLNRINNKDYNDVMNSFLTAIQTGRCRLPISEIISRL